MWPDTLRIIREVRPRLVFLENVPGLVRLYLPRVLGDLAELGFDAEWGVLGASDIGAPHQRKRLWIMACDSDSKAKSEAPRLSKHVVETDASHAERRHIRDMPQHSWATAPESRNDGETRTLADTDSKRGRGGNAGRKNAADAGEPPGSPRDYAGRVVPWHSEPAVGRVADGVANRVDRLRALGNGQVPQCYAAAWRYLERRGAS